MSAESVDSNLSPDEEASPLKKTVLYDLHCELGGRMVPFAGYDMPVQYPDGIMTEHKFAREHAGLFDVSHMGQAILTGSGIADTLESIVPANIKGLKPTRMRYSQLLNDAGGILDDLMITNLGGTEDSDRFYLVVNAACKENDLAHISKFLGADVQMEVLDTRALLALQGPKAADVISRLWPELADMPFMSAKEVEIDDEWVLASRCGYTGMDGFELSLPQARAENFARWLLGQEEVAPIGLGARDSLRLEAGLCLYGHDIDETTTPIEAGLNWSISKRRREEGGFPGADIIQKQLEHGPERKLMGVLPEGRAPVREGAEIENNDGETIGTITSGGFAPTVNGPIAMGYVAKGYEAPGTRVNLILRGRQIAASIVEMPFVPPSFYRPKK